MLAQPKDVQPDLVGQLDGLDEIVQALGRADRAPVTGSGVRFGEGIEADFKLILTVGRILGELIGSHDRLENLLGHLPQVLNISFSASDWVIPPQIVLALAHRSIHAPADRLKAE